MMTEKEVLSSVSGMSSSSLKICISQSWVTPAQATEGAMFDELDVARLRLIAELRRDMGVNDDAVPIILSLIDQLNAAQRRLRALDRAIGQDPDRRRSLADWLKSVTVQD